ncbi:nucleoside permease [Flavobacterium beibuense]|uniref:Nucleoside transporter n=1 Tax=Flavobacterium beibuense TaxID=657326 RepID=A0A444WF74_9FLAO|nr:nucleoside permease [Flavobacterium beibuense]RYJ44455.1 Nucleoside transporter [Flavobacterium beibuense]
MGIKSRLVLMNFLQFFIWGSWLISLGNYMGATLGFSGIQIGGVYTTMGIASLFMPGLLGIVADRWINAERLLGICHLAGALLLVYATTVHDYFWFYIVMLFNACVYMPTIALNNSVSYNVLEKKGYSIVTNFPPIRVWGTVGFIAAMWAVDFLGWTQSASQLYVGASASLFLGLYAFTMPPSPPLQKQTERSLMSSLGLDAFVLLKQRKMAVFFIFAMLLGAALQITNAFGGPFLDDFKSAYPDSFGVKHPNLLLSISQVSETFFILLIPFFLKRYGIKTVMLFSIVAWVFRFGLFGIGNPDDGLYLLVLSMIIYGMAFDFFNISGSMFVEKEADPTIRSSAQGLFMIMTNGLGALVGGLASGWVVDHFTVNGNRDWQSIWFTFAGYALVLAIIFPFVFKAEKE